MCNAGIQKSTNIFLSVPYYFKPLGHISKNQDFFELNFLSHCVCISLNIKIFKFFQTEISLVGSVGLFSVGGAATTIVLGVESDPPEEVMVYNVSFLFEPPMTSRGLSIIVPPYCTAVGLDLKK